MDGTTMIVYAIGAFVAILLLSYLITAQNILNQVIKYPKLELIERSQCPDYIQEMYQHKEKELLALGFEFIYAQVTTDIYVRKYREKYYFEYFHPQRQAYAALCVSPEADPYLPFWVNFSTFFQDKTRLLTVNGMKHSIMGSSPMNIIHDPYATNLHEQWNAHLEERNKILEKNPEKEIHCFANTPEGHTEKNAQEEYYSLEYIKQMEKDGYIFKTPKKKNHDEEDQFLFRTLASIRFAHSILSGLSKISKMKKAAMQKVSPLELPIPLEVQNYENTQSVLNAKQRNLAGKLTFLGITIVLFTAAFSLIFSLETALILLAVIFLHESGHLLAMFLTGYKDLRMLFIPLFGAVAIGTDSGVPPYKRVISFFAGPLPGIILAFILLVIIKQSPVDILTTPLILQVVLILIVLNYFNLIPVLPLDGGQILNTVIFSRFAGLQFFFLAFSLAALIGLGIYLESPVLFFAAIFIPLGYRNHFLRHKLTRSLQERFAHRPDVSKPEVLAEVFQELRKKPYSHYSFQKKFQIARFVEDNFNAPRASLGTVTVTLLLYTIVFIVPAIYVITSKDSLGMLFYKQVVKDPCAYVQEMEKPEVKNISASRFSKIENQSTPAEDLIGLHFCFCLEEGGNPNLISPPEFLARMWAHFDKPDLYKNGFSYTLKDENSGHIFRASLENSNIVFRGKAEEKEELLQTIYLLEELLKQTAPVDCEVEIHMDYSEMEWEDIDEESSQEYPATQEEILKMGFGNGRPFIDNIPLNATENTPATTEKTLESSENAPGSTKKTPGTPQEPME